MNYRPIFLCLLMSTKLFANTETFETERVHAVIKGNISNNTSKLWEYGITGYFYNNPGSVPIDARGSFNRTIWFDGDAQDIFLFLNNGAITIDLKKNDTLEINWDASAFTKTFSVRTSDRNRNNELQAMLALNDLYWMPFIDLERSLYTEKWNDSVKFSKINHLYNQELKSALDHEAKGNKLLTDIYFKFVQLLSSQNLLQKYDLTVTNDSVKALPLSLNFPRFYRIEQEEAFKTSSVYREFLFNYVLGNNSFSGMSAVNEDYSTGKIVPFSPAWKNYYAGLSGFKFYQLRDWFISRSIMDDFEYYSFEDAQAVYKDFLPKIKVRGYAGILSAYYKNALALKPGYMAPDFTLIDAGGKKVSLTSLRGKVVFIDFWGVGCGPCMADIKEWVPKLHEKYKDKNIAFVNICVDSHEAAWKASLKKTGLAGINLIADGWTNNPVCRLYGVRGIPHYFIIDADGKMIDNNSPQPSEQGELYPLLDKLLSE